MKPFRTYELAVKFYHDTQTLNLSGVLREQLSRAAPSIALNLAEGSGKLTLRDQVRYYNIALGSLRECQAIFQLAVMESHPLYKQADILAAHLFKLIRGTIKRR